MPVTISGGIFNFSSTGYTIPTWSGATYSFSTSLFNYTIQVFSYPGYACAISQAGMAIYDLDLPTQKFAIVTYSGGFTSIAGNNSKIFLGTTNAGIKCIDINTVSGSFTSTFPAENSENLYTFKEAPELQSNNVRYLHVYDNYLATCTNSGVEYITISGSPSYHTYTTTQEATKCFVLPNQVYYTTSTSGIPASLNRVDNCTANWESPTFIYNTTGAGIFAAGLAINDIAITKNTSVSGTNNCVFCATSSGIYAIDEGTSNYKIFYSL